jgi:hypothetical protein
MTAETLARQLMVDLFTKWPEHGRKRMRDMVEEALPAIIAAARAEEAAKGLTVEQLARAIHTGVLQSGARKGEPLCTSAAHGVPLEFCPAAPHTLHAAAILAALTPTPPPPAEVMPDGASFAWHAEGHGKDALCCGCRHHIGWHMQQCRCKDAPWCVPHPADEAHQWASLCRLPHEHVAAPTPPPPAATVDGTDWWTISRALNDLIEKRRPTHGFGDILTPADIRDAVLGTLPPPAATAERCGECGMLRDGHEFYRLSNVGVHDFTPVPEPK